MASGGLHPRSFLCAQVRVLRLCIPGRRRSSGRPLSGRSRARDRVDAGRTAGGRYDLRGGRHADPAGRRPVIRLRWTRFGNGCRSLPAGSGPSRPIPERSTPRRPTSWPKPASTASVWVHSRFSRNRCRFWSAITAASEVEQAVGLVRPRFARWSLDLIFGVPGSTLDDWRADLEIALQLGPSHLSCYGLVFEKGTPLWNQRRSGPGATRRRGDRALDVRDDDRDG